MGAAFSFFINAPRRILVIDAHERYYLSVVNLNKSKFGLLCKATKKITDLKIKVNKTPKSFRIHIGIISAA